ncbi:hypothetical protein ccbrp13_22290 [Ktedonobacteria bacterium brp13]|nr:hypothetical protein ccbrp13_22290 [Ktedonobacteria bacterium brp13]
MPTRTILLLVCLFFCVILIPGGISYLSTYENTLHDIQVKQQKIQNGVVMCADQRMQPTDFCAEVINGFAIAAVQGPSSSNGNTYIQQQESNIEDVQNEAQNNRQNLLSGTIELGAGLILLIGFFFIFLQIRRDASQVVESSN